LHSKDEAACAAADKFYQATQSSSLQVLYDDTDTSPGNKFNSNDLLGMPWQVIVSSKLTNEGLVELKNRKSGEINKLSPDAALSTLLGAQSLA
jgi:prolyl-tRNA synthetase